MLLSAASAAWAGFQPDLMVKLASEPDSAYLGTGVFESTAQLQSTSQPAFPGTPALYRVLVKNAGDQPDSILLQGTGLLSGTEIRLIDPDGVDRTAQLGAGFATPQLAPGESASYLVQVTPTLFQLGASFRVSVQGTSLGDATKLDQVKTETVACSSTAAVILSAPPDGFGPPGTVVNYPYTLTNVGNTANSFALSLSAPSGWSGALYADDGAGGGRGRGRGAPVRRNHTRRSYQNPLPRCLLPIFPRGNHPPGKQRRRPRRHPALGRRGRRRRGGSGHHQRGECRHPGERGGAQPHQGGRLRHERQRPPR
ncbi:hypothetical protein GMST_05610 [Geomonas silvestris]|uniref:Alpha-galactosidase NEW3 domain-containing protein n=1 Tax=Geomonas silvestris TaxID=2740184 RepID=A0A6V8ME20_9BACT|nr:hypothetical protein [Geomonas silvestris]GFO58236.1 hypothetical protein GMST_05610 [Geomonas silvestris]